MYNKIILIGNLMGLVPGLGGPTSYIETNLSWAIVSVVTSEAAAIRVNGFGGWLKHMSPGPIWMAPLMLPIELFSHLIRFVSLTIRLTANMFADHTLAAIFIGFGGVVSIFDEIYTGFGRCGLPFACQHLTALPDLLVVGKALANGFPMSAVLGPPHLVNTLPAGNHTSTFAAHPISCAAGCAVTISFFNHGDHGEK